MDRPVDSANKGDGSGATSGMTKINLTMTAGDVVVALSEGNPGALSVLMQIMQEHAKIDPDAGPIGFFGTFLQLDTLGIYGESLWILYKYVCGQKLDKMLLILRANQLGGLAATDDLVKDAIKLEKNPFDFAHLATVVKKDIKNFNVEVAS